MSANSLFARALRFVGILFMALTGAFTFLGGVGTSCAALFPARFGSMAALAPFQWLYIFFVIVGIILGVMGIRATVMLIRGADKSYRDAMVALVAGVVIGVIHILVSRALRGKSMPVDAVVYTTVLTLAIFLLFRLPFLWQGVDFTKARSGDNRPAGGAATILVGLLMLTIQYTMGPTHTWGGINYADAFNASITAVGLACLLLGAGIFVNWQKVTITAGRLLPRAGGVQS